MITQRKLTLEDLYALAETGRIAPEERVELIEGEIVSVSPPSSKHAGTVKDLANRSVKLYGDRVLVSVQDPVELSESNLFEPDIAFLEPREDSYKEAHPSAQDILLIIEVSLSSLHFDRDRKLPIYAAAGVPEVWIVNLEEEKLEVYREPKGRDYRLRLLLHSGEGISPLALTGAPEIVVL